MTDADWLLRAYRWCANSPDPKANVGAVLRLADNSYVIGTNSLPEGIAPRPYRTGNGLKGAYLIHAEAHAIAEAARSGRATNGATLYIVSRTPDGSQSWGGLCCDCARLVIMAGISRIVTPPFKPGPSKWRESIALGRELLAEAQVEYIEMELERGMEDA